MNPWRKITLTDIRRGTIVRMAHGESADVYADATIVALTEADVTVARPMAFASEHYDCQQPYLYAEVFTLSKTRLLEIATVSQTRNGAQTLVR